MSNARVDKKWQTTGLKDYPLEAIFGTLGHYGVTLDEPGFKKLADEKFPMGMARDWHGTWKGTGQFSPFPHAAAQELWRRLVPDRMDPSALAEGLGKLIGTLGELLKGSPDAKVGPAFQEFETLKAKMPQDHGKPKREFVEEAFAYMPEGFMGLFDRLAQELATEGHEEDAEAFAQVEEFLLPERRGISSAVVKATSGKKEDAEKSLLARLGDSGAEGPNRLMALDTLIHLGMTSQAAPGAEALLESAEKAEDHHLSLDAANRLAHLYQIAGDAPKLKALHERAERLAEAHHKAHPGHGH